MRCSAHTIERSDSLPPLSSGFVAFTFRYRFSTPFFAPFPGGMLPGEGHQEEITGSPTPRFHSAEMTGPPRFLGTPMPACPALRPRRNPGTLADSYQNYCLRTKYGVGFRNDSFEVQSHTACRPPVYASLPGLPQGLNLSEP